MIPRFGPVLEVLDLALAAAYDPLRGSARLAAIVRAFGAGPRP
jgi:hypothetical protein